MENHQTCSLLMKCCRALGMAALCVYSGNMASFCYTRDRQKQTTHVNDPLCSVETLWVRETAREDAANPKYLFSFPQNTKNFSLWFPVANKTDSLKHSTFTTGGELQLKTNQSGDKMPFLPLNMWFSLNKIFIYLSRPECIIRRL